MTETTSHFQEGLRDRLPQVRGKLTPNASLKESSWLGVGGPAEILFKPADMHDLADFLKGCPTDIPLTILGVASNTLIRDGGVPGVVIKLGPAFASIDIREEEILTGAAALDLNISRAAQEAGLAGLEFLSGIPGTLGGALRMNAGAHGGEIKDITVSILAIDRMGNTQIVGPEVMGFSYRTCAAPAGWIFISAALRGRKDNPATIRERMQQIKKQREASQPIREKTGGSTFANPTGHKAWELIDKAGCRGLVVGDAQLSTKHCNFMINRGHATAADLENLGEEVRRRVLQHSGIDLRWEIKRIGIPASQEVQS